MKISLANSDVKKDPEKYYFEIYEDRADDWRWRLKSDNGNIIADCGQGYSNRQSCINGIKIIMAVNTKTPVKEKK